MWLYLLAKNENYPDPVAEILALAGLEAGGGTPYLELTDREDAPGKGAEVGEEILLCTREGGSWSIHAQARVARPATRRTPEAPVSAIHGPTDRHRWSLGVAEIRIFSPPRRGRDFGIDEAILPRNGRAHVLHIAHISSANGHKMGSPGVDREVEEASGVGRVARIVRESSEDVTIDEKGHIYGFDGRRITKTGLEAEAVLRSLEDVKAGRVISLEAARARRR